MRFTEAAFYGPFPAEAEPSAIERLLAELPGPFDRDGDGWAIANCYALGRELERLRDAYASIKQQAFIHLATWGLPDWEDELGLPLEESLDTPLRQDVALARFGGEVKPIGPYLARIVQVQTRQGSLPDIIAYPGTYDVFKLAERGWPGTDRFREAERRVRLAKPAAFGAYVAAWDDINGITWEQLQEMSWAAIQEDTWQEITGGA